MSRLKVSEKSPGADVAAASSLSLRSFSFVLLLLVGAARGNCWNMQLYISGLRSAGYIQNHTRVFTRILPYKELL